MALSTSLHGLVAFQRCFSVATAWVCFPTSPSQVVGTLVILLVRKLRSFKVMRLSGPQWMASGRAGSSGSQDSALPTFSCFLELGESLAWVGGMECLGVIGDLVTIPTPGPLKLKNPYGVSTRQVLLLS